MTTKMAATPGSRLSWRSGRVQCRGTLRLTDVFELVEDTGNQVKERFVATVPGIVPFCFQQSVQVLDFFLGEEKILVFLFHKPPCFVVYNRQE
jgi:hypothetical protein